jgi:hypothetical protein
MKKTYLPETENGLRNWLQNFATKISDYASKYAITPSEVADIQNGAADYKALQNYADALGSFKQMFTKVKHESRNGLPPGSMPSVLTPMPAPPVLLAAPGFLIRATAIANRIKGSVQYTLSDGEDLGLEGAVIHIDYDAVKPTVSKITAFADKVVLRWKKRRMHGAIISRSLDGKVWVVVDKAFQSPWEDTSPNQTAAGEWRYYKLRYLKNDKPVGLSSDTVRVLVSIGWDNVPITP